MTPQNPLRPRDLLRRDPNGLVARLAFAAKERAFAAQARLADRRRPPDPEAVGHLPLPPPELRVKVAGKADARSFLHDGRAHQQLIASIVAESGLEPVRAGAVLDFGCGCGRTLRWWPESPELELTGCDVNGDLVAWCRENIPHVEAVVTEALPPTGFADDSFDLIYAISIFTHLTVETQQAWLGEFRRILRPGGRLVFSVCGDMFKSLLDEDELAAYEAGEPLVQFPHAEGSNLCLALHPPDYVSGRMLGDFDVAESRMGSRALLAQDLYLAR